MSTAAPLAPDPFGPAASAAAYVPYAACERALSSVESLLERPGSIVALVGPPGLGKTLLLHRTAQRAGAHLHVAYLPFCTLSLEELCAFALGLLEIEVDDDPVEVLSALARECAAKRSGLLLLVDDVGALPEETARGLSALVAQLGGALSLVFAASDSPDARRVFDAFGDRLAQVELTQGMSEGESQQYVETRLAVAGASGEVCALFDAPAIRVLHRESEGVPRRLNLAAQARLLGALGPEAVPALGAPPLPAAEERPPPLVPVPEDALAGDAAVIDSLVRGTVPRPSPPSIGMSPAPTPDERAPVVDRDELMRLGEYRYAKGRAVDEEPQIEREPIEPAAQTAKGEDEHIDRTLALLVKRSSPPPPPAAAAPDVRAAETIPPPVPLPPRRRAPFILLAGSAAAAAFMAGLYLTVGRPTEPIATVRPSTETERERVVERVPEFAPPSAERPPAPEAPTPVFAPEAVPSSSEPEAGEMEFAAPVVAEAVAEPTPLEPAAVIAEPLPPESAAVIAEPIAPEPAAVIAEPLPPEPAAVIAEPIAPESAAVIAEPIAPESAAVIAEPPPPDSSTLIAEPPPLAPPVVVADPPSEESALAGAPVGPVPVDPSLPTEAQHPQEPAAQSPLPTHAVSINARPWAVVEVDGRDLGETPIAGVELEAGTHRFRARMPDGTVREQVVEIDADSRFVVFE